MVKRVPSRDGFKDFQLRPTRRQVAELHAQGLTQVQIARELDISQPRVSELIIALRAAGELTEPSEAAQ